MSASRSASFYPYRYDTALDCLRHARNPRVGRPLQNNTRLVPCTVGDIECVGVKLHNTIVVAYLPDGNVVLNSGGWHSVTTQDRLNNWSPAKIYSQHQYNVLGEKVSPYTRWLVTTDTLGTSPVVIKKCRACKGRGHLDPYTWTPRGYVDGKYVETGPAETVTPKCHRCNETGERDYGSHRVHPYFADGVVVRQDGTVAGYGPVPRDNSISSTRRGHRRSYEAFRGNDPVLRTLFVEALGNFVSDGDSYYQEEPAVERTSYDSETVKFNKITEEAHAEMMEWMGILKGDKS